ncbi:uncharacterized protein [Rutidosis leptorrhynchoides]|uniref:uncharacterized protein n=1 Tax=Rutidosis leptorrhynchoides TaxID=125765 RepID=UPI003A9949E4
MKFLSLNIRGFGIGSPDDKVGWVKKLIKKEKPDFVAFQETRLNLVEDKWVQSIWGSPNCDFIQKSRDGMAGGQLLLWDTSSFEAVDIIRANVDRVIGVNGIWKENGSIVNVINIHGPHEDQKKVELWDALSNLLNQADEPFIMGGDFNEERDELERFNCEFIEYKARRFNDFIDGNRLIDIPLSGRNFTRVCDEGIKYSKLDRFLMNEKFFNMWKDPTALVMDRYLSDHCPIMFKDEERNFGPKPFKFFDAWLEEDGIEQVILDAWTTPIQNINRKDCVFRNKLKCVKNALQDWSKSYNSLDGDIEVLKDAVTNLELKAETCNLSDSEKILWRESRKKWLEKEMVKSCMLKQKARVKWTLDGDENTKFFHSVIKRNNNVCNIRGLVINGIWNDSPTDIKNEVFRHFKCVFEEPNG